MTTFDRKTPFFMTFPLAKSRQDFFFSSEKKDKEIASLAISA
jgi:hypothetical protein